VPYSVGAAHPSSLDADLVLVLLLGVVVVTVVVEDTCPLGVRIDALVCRQFHKLPFLTSFLVVSYWLAK
jgi:hypothetical protein